MAIPKRGSRKLVVGDVTYRWNIRHKPTHCQGDLGSCATVAIELFESPGAVLSIEFPWPRCDNYVEKVGTVITPRHIESSISIAIEKGWQPKVPGPTFVVRYEQKYNNALKDDAEVPPI